MVLYPKLLTGQFKDRHPTQNIRKLTNLHYKRSLNEDAGSSWAGISA
ncbi:hypothetical protein [Chryseobacterium aquaticum]